MKRITLIVISLVMALVAMANDIIVVGRVLSEAEYEPIVGATVSFKGTEISTLTDKFGSFVLIADSAQKKICISAEGYKNISVRLDGSEDKALQIVLQEDINLFQQVMLMPENDRVFSLLQRCREYHQPAIMPQNQTSKVGLITTKSYQQQRQIFKSIDDSILFNNPNLVEYEQDTISSLSDFAANANLYKRYIPLGEDRIISPVARIAQIYYNADICDSFYVDSRKIYDVRVWPKDDSKPLFKGHITVDSLTNAMVSYDLYLTNTYLVDKLSSYKISGVSELRDTLFVPTSENIFIGVKENISTQQGQYYGAVLQKEITYQLGRSSEAALDSTISTLYGMQLENSVQLIEKDYAKFDKWAKIGLDIFLNQYAHVWLIDVGPLLNLFHYNALEGASPRISLRSGERFSKSITFGGFYGYGFNDRDHKFGGNVRWRFGERNNNELKISYEKKVMRYGYDEMWVYYPNRVHEMEQIFSAVEMITHGAIEDVALHRQLMAEYKYNRPIGKMDFNMTLRLLGERVKDNRFNPFIYQGRMYRYIERLCLQGNFRLSWEEHSLDNYFHRYYVSSRYPVVNLTFDVGYCEAGNLASLYGKFGLYVNQSVALEYGKLRWAVQLNFTAGRLPYPWLVFARRAKAYNYNSTDLVLVQPMEFISDTYGCVTSRYQTRGYIFGYIPMLKRLGIREDIIINMAYGGIVNKGSMNLLQMPLEQCPWRRVPYIECGIGFSNIFKIIDVDFVWRLTYRDTPNAQNFGVYLSVEL